MADTRCLTTRQLGILNYRRPFRCWLFGHDACIKSECCNRQLVCARCDLALGEPWRTGNKCPQEFDVRLSADTANFKDSVAKAINELAETAHRKPLRTRKEVLP